MGAVGEVHVLGAQQHAYVVMRCRLQNPRASVFVADTLSCFVGVTVSQLVGIPTREVERVIWAAFRGCCR